MVAISIPNAETPRHAGIVGLDTMEAAERLLADIRQPAPKIAASGPRADAGVGDLPRRARPRRSRREGDPGVSPGSGREPLESSPLQRRLRDLHAAAQHAIVQQRHYAGAGKLLLDSFGAAREAA
jgi:hypothetical protein